MTFGSRHSTAGGTLLFAALLACASAAPPPEDLIVGTSSGPWRRLFLDSTVVEDQAGLDRVFHSPEKHASNPVVPKDKSWEGPPGRGGPYLYGTVMRQGERLRMWHQIGGGGNRNGYAESVDGIVWTKPNLGLVAIRGSTENNVFLWTTQNPNEDPPYKKNGQCHNPCVIHRPWEEDPAKRYALFCYSPDYRKARAAFSPDGLRWTFVPETADEALFPSSDVLNFFHDPYQERYVATVKTGSRRGRAVTMALSKDGLDWERPVPGPVFVADDLDPDATQVYGMPVFPYQGLYIGQPWIYHARWFKEGRYTDKRMGEAEKGSACTVDVQLSWSWDLINWTRPPGREPFIPLGAEGEFDSHMIYTATGPVQVRDRLYFYYGGWNGPHDTREREAAIGLAALRLDGFCSLRAGPEEGWLISRRESFNTPAVIINARTKDEGYVVAEILDRHDRVMKGFSRSECLSFVGDATRHRLTWKKTAFDESQLEGDKKLRFYLRRAELYSYLPEGVSASAP